MQPSIADPSISNPNRRPQPMTGVLERARSIHEVVEYQAVERPDAVALTCEGRRLTYEQLNSRANQVARRLRALGIGSGDRVGILMGRSERTVIAILGVLKAGACYVPVDLAYPRDRVAFILGDSEAKALVTETAHLELTGAFEGGRLCLDADFSGLSGEPADNLERSARPDPAYVIYTSGSTGQPKGVMVSHHNVLRLFEATDPWFKFGPSDVWTIFHSFAFDFSVWEIWGALFYGGSAVVVPYCVSRNPADFHALLVREHVTVLNQTPSAFRQLMWAEENAAEQRALSLRYVIFGGEALELQSLRKWFERHAPDAPRLVNMYGITETTVHVTWRPIEPADIEANAGSVIGQPIPDLTLHLLDENGRPVPDETPGEIYVGGEGVALGYLNRPELNAARFIADPFSGKEGARLYRSGDLARRLTNGDLEYLGRIDHQVKIHGFRIELGEIETVLNSHPGVRESIVLCDESTGEKRLVAWVVGRDSWPGVQELREFASRRLPAYMVPARMIALEKMPLTVNGKVDRRALPAPDSARPELSEQYLAPRSPEEKTLAEIWQRTLGLDQVGVNDNFFKLGGDSIRSIQVLAQAQEAGLNFSLQKLFQSPTIAELAKNLDLESEDRVERDLPSFALISDADRKAMPAGVVDAYPIGRLQHGMIFHSDLDKESAIFHDVFSFRLRLPYDRDQLIEAVSRLTQRHSIFRTSFHLEGFSEPLQLVHERVSVPFSEEDLRSITPEEQRASLIEWVEREKRHRFDWETAPLMRLHVQRYQEETFQFIVSFHHAIMDGWSLAMMLTELFQDYMALVSNSTSPIQAPRVNYRDFVALEQKTVSSEASQTWWKSVVENAVTHTLPRWPHRPSRKAHEQTRGPEIYYPASLLKSLQELARNCGVPIRTVLLAAHCRVMKQLTGTADIMTGLVANGRPQCLDGERLIGLFLNTIPFRVQVEDQSWRELIRQTFAAEQALIPHRRMPLADIQQLAGGKTLFETTFDFVQFHVYRDLPGYKEHSFLEDYYFEANNFNFFVTFMLDASASELQMHFDYNPNEFSAEQIQSICDCFSETLRAMGAAPNASINSEALLPAEQRRKLLTEWNATSAKIPEQGAHEWVAEQARRNPETIAAIYKDSQLTYRELNARADRVAAELQNLGAAPGTLAGVFIERSLEMLIAILAVLKSGAAYVPLDPNYPSDRLSFMVRDSGLPLIITSNALLGRADELGEARICNVDQLPDRAAPLRPVEVTGEDSAYVIYTSGSTGTPKGVQIPHRALSNFLASMQREPGLTPGDRLLAVTTLSFDIAGLELWLPCVTGSTVVLASSEEARDPAALARLIDQHEVTVMQATPVTWNALLHSGWKGRKGIKALCGGEPMTRQLADGLLNVCGEVWNMYGPTETTIWSTLSKVEPGDEAVSIGRPIANTQIYILDQHLQPVPVGSDGEIFIGGAGLAAGYLNRPELTAQKFIPSPFEKGARLYRTGDLGRYLPDGRILCLGRTDHQVKVRGFRIELGEIEAALEQMAGVRKAVVTTQEDGAASRELVAFWMAADSSRITQEDLRRSLQGRLPGYMVPTAWMQVNEFPLTPNGKIDRKRLPVVNVRESTSSSGTTAAPRSPLEIEIADTWKSLLKVRDVGLTDDFFELGGHSLLAMRVVSSLRSKYKVDISVGKFFQEPTVQALAAHVEKLVRSFAAQSSAGERAPALDKTAAV